MQIKRILCLLLIVFCCFSYFVGAAEITGDVTKSNAAYQYIVPESDLNRAGEIYLYDMTYLLSRLFCISEEPMTRFGNSWVRHNVLLDFLNVYCGMDISLVDRDYSKESAYLTYEQFFAVMDCFYFEILKRHGLTAEAADVYSTATGTHIALGSGDIVELPKLPIADGRAVVTKHDTVIVEISPISLPESIPLSSVHTMRKVSGVLYYDSYQEGMLLLASLSGIHRYDIIKNPVCFAKDGIKRGVLNETMMDQAVTLYVTNHKKVPDVVVMITQVSAL